MIARILLGVALVGILTSTVYVALVMVAAVRFKRRCRAAAPSEPAPFPPVSLLKPLHGAEPGLREYLESFFALDYPKFEILFCARTDQDPGLEVAREVAAAHPEVPVRFLLSGQPPWPNARCYSLSVMAPEAAHEILAITDSDVRVRPDFLRQVIPPLANDRVGAATCIYRGDATGRGFWALLEGLGMSVEMTAGVLVADLIEGMRFTLGPCMIVRKDALAAIGGFSSLGYYYADDFMLGSLVAASGRTVVLSTQVVDHCIINDSLRHNFSHQWSWMKSTRVSRPMGHLGTGLTFSVPFGLLGLLACWLMHMPLLGAGLFAWACLSRIFLCLCAGGWVVGDPAAYRDCWLYPLRDLIGAFVWAASYTSRRVGWRDDRFVLEKGGLMRKIAPPDALPRAPLPKA